jgi:geranylgeranyl diphosphate synthase type I
MDLSRYQIFFDALKTRAQKVNSMIFNGDYRHKFAPKHLNEAVYSYFELGGKALRPGVLLFSCGAVGGEEERALPAAAGLEAYHTWTLVHDDIIDRDQIRRGGATVHQRFADVALKEMGCAPENAVHYGMTMGILAGDVQHGWAVSFFGHLKERGVSPELTLKLIIELESVVLPLLLEGETLDVQFEYMPLAELSQEMVLDMLWKKTGALYRFAGMAGAMIGLNSTDRNHPLVKALSQYTSNCGLAFQLVDDILGLLGDEEILGKPVGSDIREGKRTVIVLYGWSQANPAKRKYIERVLGDPEASEDSVKEVIGLLQSLGGVEFAKEQACALVQEARHELDHLAESEYKRLLEMWGNFVLERDY